MQMSSVKTTRLTCGYAYGVPTTACVRCVVVLSVLRLDCRDCSSDTRPSHERLRAHYGLVLSMTHGLRICRYVGPGLGSWLSLFLLSSTHSTCTRLISGIPSTFLDSTRLASEQEAASFGSGPISGARLSIAYMRPGSQRAHPTCMLR